MTDSLEPQFLSPTHYDTPAGVLLFEVKSRIGRALQRFQKKPPMMPWLNIGSGQNVREDFVNLDFFCFRRAVPWHQVDLRYPLPFESGCFAGAYSEHCIEHLYPVQALSLFREVFRVLRGDGLFRCAVPDLGKYIAFYGKRNDDPQFGQFTNGCEAIWNLTQNWGHKSVWDAEMLSLMLKKAGFARVATCEFREGQRAELLIDSEARSWETLYVEANKS